MSDDVVPAGLVAKDYPAFRPAGAFIDAPSSWIGTIQPFGDCTHRDVVAIIEDLAADAVVLVSGGQLRHDPACRRQHQPLPYPIQLGDVDRQRFCVRLVVWPPPVHPKIIALVPEISSTVFPTHPHLFRAEPRAGLTELLPPMPDAVCTYRPGDGEWSWATGDLVSFLDYAAIFLAKHLVWVRTGGARGGRWIGHYASHAAQDLLGELDPNGECRCGSGRRYRLCHRPVDQLRARRGRAA